MVSDVHLTTILLRKKSTILTSSRGYDKLNIVGLLFPTEFPIWGALCPPHKYVKEDGYVIVND